MWQLIGRDNANLTSDGQTILPSGLIVKWGSFSFTGSSAVTRNFPSVFPNACFSVVTSPLYAGNNNVGVVSFAKTGFVVDGTAASNYTLRYTAFGY